MRPLFDAALSATPDDTWALELAHVARGCFDGAIGLGLQLVEHQDFWPTHIKMLGIGTLTEGERFATILQVARSMGQQAVRSVYMQPASMMSQLLPKLGFDPSLAYEPFGGIDVGGVTANGGPSSSLSFIFELDRRYAFTQHEERVLTRLSLYLELGARARKGRAFSCVLSANGAILEGRSHDLWPGLCAGRYSLLRRGRAGATHFAVIDNTGTDWTSRALTTSEVRVLELSARGATGKEQAFALGLSVSAVSARLVNGAAKLGFASTLEAIRVVAGIVGPNEPLPSGGLTQAERAVLELLRQGLSNDAIASERKTSGRTVANQVAALLRKTGQPSRRALLTWS